MSNLQRRLEKLEVGRAGPRRGLSLEQLVTGSLGLEVGAPALVLRDSELDLEQLVSAARPVEVAR